MDSALTIRRQLLWAIGAVACAVALVLVGAILYISQHQLHVLGERNTQALASSVAARSGFAAIVGVESPDIARRLLGETVGRGGIVAAELLDDGNRSLARLDDPGRGLAACRFGAEIPEPLAQTSSRQLGRIWCVSVPVFQASRAGTCTAKGCVIGRLRVVASTAPVDDVVRRLVIATLSVSGVLLAVALACSWRIADRITSPLRIIAEVMRRFSAGERSARAPDSGPREVRTIARVYNGLIDRQEQQARILEETVERRTRELREATHAAQEAERYKSTFMARISHDMRTPLHVIEARAAEVLQELEFWKDGARARMHAEIIVQEVAELALRVTQVLELMRGDAAQDDLQIASISLERLRTYILEKAETLARANGNQLRVSAGTGEVISDVDKVLQIISNLVDNACKYTSQGTVEVQLWNETGWFHLRVADTGIGIPAAALPHVWTGFRQVQSLRGRRVGGFGLGLAIVRSYVSLLGGKCDIASTVCQGTTVSVAIPLMAADSIDAAQSS